MQLKIFKVNHLKFGKKELNLIKEIMDLEQAINQHYKEAERNKYYKLWAHHMIQQYFLKKDLHLL